MLYLEIPKHICKTLLWAGQTTNPAASQASWRPPVPLGYQLQIHNRPRKPLPVFSHPQPETVIKPRRLNAPSQNAGAIKPSADAAGGARRNKQKSNNCHYEAMRPARLRSLPAHRQRYVDVQTRTRASRVQLLCQSTVTGRLFHLSHQFTASVPLIKNILGLSKNDLSGPFSLHRYYRVHSPFGPGNNPLPLASTSQSKHPTGCCSILSPAR